MKDDHSANSHYLTYTLLFRKVGECTFWTWEWKGKSILRLIALTGRKDCWSGLLDWQRSRIPAEQQVPQWHKIVQVYLCRAVGSSERWPGADHGVCHSLLGVPLGIKDNSLAFLSSTIVNQVPDKIYSFWQRHPDDDIFWADTERAGRQWGCSGQQMSTVFLFKIFIEFVKDEHICFGTPLNNGYSKWYPANSQCSIFGNMGSWPAQWCVF